MSAYIYIDQQQKLVVNCFTRKKNQYTEPHLKHSSWNEKHIRRFFLFGYRGLKSGAPCGPPRPPTHGADGFLPRAPHIYTQNISFK